MNPEPLTAQQLNAFVDGELDLNEQIEIEARVAQDEALKSQVDALRAVSEATRAKADYHATPAELRQRLAQRASVSSPRPQPSSLQPGRTAVLAGWWFGRPALTGLALTALVAWAATIAVLRPNHDDLVMQEAVGSHVRATFANRLIDVASSDQHTVKPWLSSKLDFAPPVKDMAATGVTLLGGRIDYIDGHPVAAVVYRQRQHVINLFIWPTSQRDAAIHASALRGFNIVHEVHGGMTYWAVSDINREDLMSLVAGQMSGVADR